MIVSCSFGSPAFRLFVFSTSRSIERVGDRLLDDDPARRHADLALVEERAERGGVDRVVEVGVGEDDQRVRAAELEHDALQVSAGRLRDPAARSRSSP